MLRGTMKNPPWMFLILIYMIPKPVSGVAPNIVYSHSMRILKLPLQTKVGSIIYRLKGSDPDPEPITFGVRGTQGRDLLDIKQAGFREADVILKKTPDKEKYTLTLFVTDGKETTEVDSVIQVTDAPDLTSPFLDYSFIVHLPENSARNVSIASISVKEREDRSLSAIFELNGSRRFAVRYIYGPRGTSTAEIRLVESVDYERQNVFPLKIIAINVWTNRSVDTRNVAVAEMAVLVDDIQDEPPFFTKLPSIVKLHENIRQGDVVFRVWAEDGDYGDQRSIAYEVVSGEPWTNFFQMNGSSGEVKFVDSVSVFRRLFQKSMPLIVKIKCTELNGTSLHPALSAEAEVVLMLVNALNHPPRFESQVLTGIIEENSPTLTAVQWNDGSIPRVIDEDQGRNGTFLVYLEDNSETFEVHPNEGVGELSFSLLVKKPSNIDYEASQDKILEYQVVAREVDTPERFTVRADVRIRIKDVNDNYPQFTESQYHAYVTEDASVGTEIIRIQATDVDSGEFGKIRYSISGRLTDSVRMDPESGVLSVISSKAFDRELTPEYTLSLEARDEFGKGHRNVTQLYLHLLDSNDNAPVFSQPRYDAVLNSDKATFYKTLYVQAYDADETGPNSMVSYEIYDGNYQNKFRVDPTSGEISLTERLSSTVDWTGDKGLPPIILSLRAYDKGVPVQQATVKVHVHGQEFLNRSVSFVLPLKEADAQARKDVVERSLSVLTGTTANVYAIGQYNASSDKQSMVQAWVAYPLNSMVNIRSVDAALAELLGKEYQYGKDVERLNVSGMNYNLVFWLLIALVVLIILAMFIVCCYCLCCRATVGNRLKVDVSEVVTPKDKGSKGEDKEGTAAENPRQAWRDDDQGWANGLPADSGRGDRRTNVKQIQERSQGRVTPSRTSAHVRANGRIINRQSEQDSERPETPDYHYAPRRLPIEDNDGRYFVVRREIPARGPSYPPYSHAGFYSDMQPPRAPRKTEILYIRSPPRDDPTALANEDGFVPRSVSQNDMYRTQRRIGHGDEYGRPARFVNDMYYNSADFVGYSRFPGEIPVEEGPTEGSFHRTRSRLRPGEIQTMVPISEVSLNHNHIQPEDRQNNHHGSMVVEGRSSNSQIQTLEIPGEYQSFDTPVRNSNVKVFDPRASLHSARENNTVLRQHYNLDTSDVRDIDPSLSPSQEMDTSNQNGPPKLYNSYKTGDNVSNSRLYQNEAANGSLHSSNVMQRLSTSPVPVKMSSGSTANAECQTPPDLYQKKSSGKRKENTSDVSDGESLRSSAGAKSVPSRKARSVEEIAHLGQFNSSRKFKSTEEVSKDDYESILRQKEQSKKRKSLLGLENDDLVLKPGNDRRAALVTNTPLNHIEKEMHMDEDDNLQQILNGKSLGNESDEKKLQRRTLPESKLEEILYSDLKREHTELEPVFEGQNDLNDSDSGIGGIGRLKLKNSNFLEKKSVFTIAYDGIQTRKLKSEDGRVATP